MPRKLFTREEWGAQPPRKWEVEEKMVTKAVLTYVTNTLTCGSKLECFGVLQKMQRSHFKRGMSDIAYNFLIGGCGNIYEGRGFGVKPSSSLRLPHGQRLDIAFIGNHTPDTIPYLMFKSGFEVLNIGQQKKYVSMQCDLDEIIKPVYKNKRRLRSKDTDNYRIKTKRR